MIAEVLRNIVQAVFGGGADVSLINPIPVTDISLPKYQGLIFAGTVSGIAGAPNFQCSNLTGFGNDYFEGYWAYVVWDAAGGGGAPQGQSLVCTGYVSATGDFTVNAFAPVITVGDKVLLIHPAVAYMLGLTPARAAFLDAAVSSRASDAEVQTTSLATGAGSNATLTRLGLLIRWITDNVALAVTALSTATWSNALATALGLDSAPTAVSKLQTTPKTFDLAQAGGVTYDLFTATTQDVVVEKLVIRMSGGTLVGSNLTSILIQTDDATPIVLIDIAAGAVANLTNEAQLAWTGAILLDAGTSAKIQITLNGGAATAAKVADVIAECRAVVAGGYLA